MPFSGTLAWTAVALWGAAGFMRGGRVSRRLAWIALSAFGLGQVGAAHITNGLVIGFGALSCWGYVSRPHGNGFEPEIGCVAPPGQRV